MLRHQSSSTEAYYGLITRMTVKHHVSWMMCIKIHKTLRTSAANTLPSLHHYRSSWRGKPRPETPTRQRAENSATYDRQGKWLQRSARAGTRDFHHDTTCVYSAVTRSSSSNYSELRDIQQQSALDRHTDRQAGIQTSIDTSGEAIQYSVMRHSNTHTYEQTE